MDVLGITVFRVITVFALLIAVWLLTGRSHLGETTPAELVGLIIFGTVAGAAILSPQSDFSDRLVVLTAVGLMQCGTAKLVKCLQGWRTKPLPPLVIIEQGQPIRANLAKTRLSVKTLLVLLRAQGIFHLKEVQLAVWESLGGLSILRAAEGLSEKGPVGTDDVAVPVIIEGELQEKVLENLGFTPEDIVAFKSRHKEELKAIMVAYMNKSRQLWIVRDKPKADTVL